MSIRQTWTDNELEILEEAYKMGHSEKEIARNLNRTLRGVSKRIDRLGLRQKYSQERKEAREEKARTQPRHKPSESPLPSSNFTWFFDLPADAQRLGKLAKGRLNWVTLADVIQWLETQGIVIQKSPAKGFSFRSEGAYLSDGQVLLKCNRLRLQQKLPIMHVPGITEID